MNNNLPNKYLKALEISITIILTGFCLYLPYYIVPDTQGYINMDIYRSCGYAIFTNIFKFIFGNYFLDCIKITQIFLTVFAAFFLKNCLINYLKLKDSFATISYLLLLIPLVYEQRVGNKIFSEGLAYPLYVFLIGFLLKACIKNHIKSFYIALIFAYLIIQVRGQFLFVSPLIILVMLFVYKKQVFNAKKRYIFILAFLLPFISIGTDILYHKIKHNYAGTTPFTGIQICSLPFYISEKNDVESFTNKQEKAYFTYIHNIMNSNNLTCFNKSDMYLEDMDYFYNNYVKIANYTLSQKGDLFFIHAKNAEEQTILNDKLTNKMYWQLVKNHWAKYIKLIYQNIAKGMGTSKNVMLIVLLLVLSIFKHLKKPSSFSVFVILGCLAILGNAMLVAIAEPVTSRYVFYNNWIILTIILLLWQKAFYKNNHD
jgi:hypothetical protein